jgi:hypothetical protein
VSANDSEIEGELLPRQHGLSKYTPEVAHEICRLMAEEGRTVRWVCRQDGMPSFRTVMRWAREKPEFADLYRQALVDRYDFWAEQIIDIADDASNDIAESETADGRKIQVVNHENIQRARLRIDTRKFVMATGAPRKYGDRVSRDDDPGDARTPAQIGSDIERTRRILYILRQAKKLSGPVAR